LGEFLSEFRWDWFVTLTFEHEVKSFTAYRRCKAWLGDLERAAAFPIAWFRADEYGERTGRFHLHLLIANVEHLHRLTWMKRWEQRNGYARILPFDPGLGAAFYVSKYVTKQAGEWDISDNLGAFRVQQVVLPLTEQRVTMTVTQTNNDAKRTSVRTRRKRTQLALSDFTEHESPGSDPLRDHIRQETRRRR